MSTKRSLRNRFRASAGCLAAVCPGPGSDRMRLQPRSACSAAMAPRSPRACPRSARISPAKPSRTSSALLASDPDNVTANLLASTSAVELYQGPLAVQYAEKAEKLDPQNWKIHTTLVAAYAAAGMMQQRDKERGPAPRTPPDRCLRCPPRYRLPDRDVSHRRRSRRRHRVLRAGRTLPHLVSLPRPPARRQAHLAKSTSRATTSIRSPGRRRTPPKPPQATASFRSTATAKTAIPSTTASFSGKPDYDNIRVMVVEALRAHPIAGTQPVPGH